MTDIVIRAKNGHELTGRCIESIRRNTPEGTYRIVLVDDGSEEPYTRFDWQGVSALIRYSPSRGAVSATNAGIGLCLHWMDAPYVAVFDNDTRIPDGDTGWLARFEKALEDGGERCGCVGATTNFANPPQHILSSPQTYAADWTDEKRGISGRKGNPDVVWFVSFACLLRKQAVREVGPWDERYNPGNYEDTDYAVQLRTAGWTVKVAQSVYIHHDGHRTFSNDLRRLLNENAEKFYGKWGVGRLFDLGVVDKESLREAIS